MSDPLDLGIRALGSAYAAGSLSPVETTRLLLERIAADDKKINAFALIDANAAMAAARESEARFRADVSLGPLDGVPVSIKDLFNVAGWPTRRGSHACDGDPPAAADAPMVASLRRGGAVIFGKTTTAEFGWAAISDCPATGITRNPRNPAHSAGGSSGGAAAHIAMGWGPLAIGSDAGGSIRIPASYCGIVGFKPTWGSVPQAPLSALGDISHPGPMTRTVDDCALALAILAAPDPRDGGSLFARTLPARPPRSLRIGWAPRFAAGAELDPAIETAFGDCVAMLGRDGYDLREIAPAGLDAIAALWPFWLSRNYESFAVLPPEKRALLDPRLLRMFDAASLLDMPTLAASRTALRGVANHLAELFAEIDILLSPATATVAPLAGEIVPRGHGGFARAVAEGNWFPANPYAYPFNLTQQPAISLPLGRDAGSLPFGLQIAGRKYHDDEVLGLARVIEAQLR
jgi:aspartyl-tRNA(Asn)/glutamyl-tRNA(Gln) amidotransferase subunit A